MSETITTENYDELGVKLAGDFETAKSNRKVVEDRWIEDLRQYKGEYKNTKNFGKRAKVFVKATRLKVETLSRLMMANMFGNANETSWSIQPSPSPDVSEQDWQAIVSRMIEAKPDAKPEDFEKACKALVEIRARNMTTEIQDQLDYNEERKWTELNRKCINSSLIYGTGILKGPLTESYMTTKWSQSEEIDPITGQIKSSWKAQREEKLRPYIEFIPVWDIYPSGYATDIKDSEAIFQRHIKSKQELRNLAKREDFDKSKILEYISAHPEGDASTFENYETQLNSLSADDENPKREKQYELIEFWGIIEKKYLQSFVEGDVSEDMWCNVFMLGKSVVKIAIQPIDNVKLPYYFSYFDKDETSIWGTGLPYLTRDMQIMMNSSIRIMLDNAAISSGPQLEINMDLLNDGQDVEDVYPWKLWLRGGDGQMKDPNAPAIRAYEIPSTLQDVSKIFEISNLLLDDVSGVPKVDGGDEKVGQAASTASGLSMLMNRSNTMTREALLRYDDCVIRPIITNIYHWNMQFNDKPEIKGDYQIKARGIQSGMAKEFKVQSLMNFYGLVRQDPQLMSFLKLDEFIKEIATNNEISSTVLRDKEEADAWMQQQQQQAMQQQNQQIMSQLAPVLQKQEQAIQTLAKNLQEIKDRPDEQEGMSLMDQHQIQIEMEKLRLEEERIQAEIALKEKEIEANIEIKRFEAESKAHSRLTEQAQ